MALTIAALPLVAGIIGVVIDAIFVGFQYQSIASTVVNTVLSPLFFSCAAFVALAFIKPVWVDGPVAALAAPVLIAAGIGGAVLIAYEYISSAIQAVVNGATYSANLGSVIGSVIWYAILLGLGAAVTRARLWRVELAAGAPARHAQVVNALIVAGIVLVEPIVTTILSSLSNLQYGGFSPVFIGTVVLKSVLFALVTLLVLLVIRPLAAMNTVANVLVGVATIAGIGLVVEMILVVILGVLEGSLGHFFGYTIISSVWLIIECSAVAALALLVLLAVRGQRVLTGRAPRVQAVPPSGPAGTGW